MPDERSVSLTPSTLGPDAEGAAAVPRELGSVSLEREIGRGGMGVVWLGHDRLLRRPVAVKFLLNAVSGTSDPGFERFLEGARAAAAVRHPALTHIHTADLIDGIPYLVMEYVNGPTADELIRRHGPLNLAAALAVLEPVCGAVAELHERGLVHRDIKPANVLLDADGRVFVTDFGLACSRPAPGTARVAGTPLYMAPEMFQGTVSPRSDVYAIAVMAFELLTGNTPFSGAFEQVREAHCTRPFPVQQLLDRHIEPCLTDVLERAAHKDAKFRYKSAIHLFRAARDAYPDPSAWSAGTQELASAVLRVTSRAISAPPGEVAPGSSYYERLATRAEDRRKARPSETALDASAVPATPHRSELAADVNPPGSPPQPSVHVRRGDRHAVLRLTTCPDCNYSLEGLPRRHRCPECGFDYDESMFVVRGSGPKGSRAQRQIQFTLALLLGVLGTQTFLSAYFPWLLLTYALLTLAIGAIRHWLPAWRLGDRQVFFSSSAVRQRQGSGRPLTIPWPVLRSFRWRSFGRSKWRLVLSGGWIATFLGRHPMINVIVPGARRDAALVRGEIRRRLRAHARPSRRVRGLARARSKAEIRSIGSGDTLTLESPCIQCGYDLRGLSLSGRCPECGLEIARSHDPNLLRYADRDWLTRVKLGTDLLFWGFVVGVAAMVATPALLSLGVSPQLASTLVQLVNILFYVAGALLIAARDPRRALTEAPLSRRRMVRHTVLVSLLATSANIIAGLGNWNAFAISASIVATIAGSVTIVLIYSYLRSFALRMPSYSLARSSTIASWGLAISIALAGLSQRILEVLGAIGIAVPRAPSWYSPSVAGVLLIFWLWAVLLLAQYSRAFAAVLARRRRTPA